MTTQYVLAYIAGFVDDEGCVRVNNNGSIELSIINTCQSTLEIVKETLGGVVGDRKQKVNKKQYHYRIYGVKAVEALNRLLPFLREKKKQAELAVQWMDTRALYLPVSKDGLIGRFSNPEWEAALKEVQQKLSELKRV